MKIGTAIGPEEEIKGLFVTAALRPLLAIPGNQELGRVATRNQTDLQPTQNRGNRRNRRAQRADTETAAVPARAILRSTVTGSGSRTIPGICPGLSRGGGGGARLPVPLSTLGLILLRWLPLGGTELASYDHWLFPFPAWWCDWLTGAGGANSSVWRCGVQAGEGGVAVHLVPGSVGTAGEGEFSYSLARFPCGSAPRGLLSNVSLSFSLGAGASRGRMERRARGGDGLLQSGAGGLSGSAVWLLVDASELGAWGRKAVDAGWR